MVRPATRGRQNNRRVAAGIDMGQGMCERQVDAVDPLTPPTTGTTAPPAPTSRHPRPDCQRYWSPTGGSCHTCHHEVTAWVVGPQTVRICSTSTLLVFDAGNGWFPKKAPPDCLEHIPVADAIVVRIQLSVNGVGGGGGWEWQGTNQARRT
jgi:hypothetical protein